MERAENTARLLDVNGQDLVAVRTKGSSLARLEGLLSISELMPEALLPLLTRGSTPANVLDFMVRDGYNPSSIVSVPGAARENARAVRGALTTEVWKPSTRPGWSCTGNCRATPLSATPASFWNGEVPLAPLARVTAGTMLQDEAFHSLRMGTFLERADNTARLLDVKFHAVQNDSLAAPVSATRKTTSTTGAPSCAASRRSRCTARSTAT